MAGALCPKSDLPKAKVINYFGDETMKVSHVWEAVRLKARTQKILAWAGAAQI